MSVALDATSLRPRPTTVVSEMSVFSPAQEALIRRAQ